MTFNDLPLSSCMLKGIQDLGFQNPTPIQEQVIPVILKGRDVCALAQTGSGKTASYTIPLLEKIAAQRKRTRLPSVLILVPTRELAQQVSESLVSLGKYFKGLSSTVLIGGTSPLLQERQLRGGVDIIIATPGRLLDHFERGSLIFHNISMVIIDEADRMLDMGFVPDIEQLMTYLPRGKFQTLCFSATMPKPIQKLVDDLLTDPVQIKIEHKLQPADTIEQVFVLKAGTDRTKRAALRGLIEKEVTQSAIVFCNRKIDVATLTRSLTHYKVNAASLHGDMTQSKRSEALLAFKEGKIKYLIASDVAARGLDIEQLPVVINFDIPLNGEEYVHRVGRTGRAGNKGTAYTFIDAVDGPLHKKIQRYIPPNARYIDAPQELLGADHTPQEGKKAAPPPRRSKERASKAPQAFPNFAFPSTPTVGFGPAVPNFILTNKFDL